MVKASEGLSFGLLRAADNSTSVGLAVVGTTSANRVTRACAENVFFNVG